MFTENSKVGAPPLQVLQKACQGSKLPVLAKLQTDTYQAQVKAQTEGLNHQNNTLFLLSRSLDTDKEDTCVSLMGRLCHSDLHRRLTTEESRLVWCPQNNPSTQDIRRDCHQIEASLVYIMSYMSARTT